MPSNPDIELIRTLQQKVVAAFEHAFAGASTYALVDFPNHGNCGDNAIWLGERAALRSLAGRVAYSSDIVTHRTDDITRIQGLDVVLLHGGGNVGELWPQHARFRESAVSNLSGYNLIQLPQTISRDSAHHLARLNHSASQGRPMTFMVRDVASLELLAPHSHLVGMLVPDAAFALGPIQRTCRPDVDVVWISRTDHERAYDVCPGAIGPDRSLLVTDWSTWQLERRAGRVRTAVGVRSRRSAFRALAAAPRIVRRNPIWILDLLARRRLHQALTVLSSGRVVVTDRLHGHILALQLGIPHVLLDTSERKLRNFHLSHTVGSQLTQVASTPEEAAEIAGQLVSESAVCS